MHDKSKAKAVTKVLKFELWEVDRRVWSVNPRRFDEDSNC